MLKFAVESGKPEIERLTGLIQQHLIDVRGDDHDSTVDLDWYVDQNEQNLLMFCTARDDVTGDLVGYSTVFFYHEKHKDRRLEANVDSVFILPDYRKGMNGVRFLRYIEQQAKIRGASCLYQSTTPAINFGSLLDRMGYDLTTLTYCKELESDYG